MCPLSYYEEDFWSGYVGRLFSKPSNAGSEHANEYSISSLRDAIEEYVNGGLYNQDEDDSFPPMFTQEELSAIVSRDLEGGSAEYGQEGYDSNKIKGDAVEDAILWPLSVAEASALPNKLCFCHANPEEWMDSDYWLRSPGESHDKAAAVFLTCLDESGNMINHTSDEDFTDDLCFQKTGHPVNEEDFCPGVRPAMYLDQNAILFTSAAVGGKSSENAESGSLDPVGTNTTGEWKITLRDDGTVTGLDGHAGFAVSDVSGTENEIAVSYTGAATGENEYISAIITDKPLSDASAKITYYGRIKSCASENNAAGTATINAAGILGENDHLYVFNERYNGDLKTDYAGTPKEVKLPEQKPQPEPKPEVKVSGTLLAKMTSKGKTNMVISWTKVTGAKGYDIFFSKCSGKNEKKIPKKIKTIKGNSTFQWTKKSLKKKTSYKTVVKAWTMKDGKKTYVRTSPMVHAYTSGGSDKYTNAKSVSVKKTSVSLKAGKTSQIKATVNKVSKSKKLIASTHAPKLRYISSNKKIATVSSSGKITAKAKGSCKIYVISVNGARKTVNVTVK